MQLTAIQNATQVSRVAHDLSPEQLANNRVLSEPEKIAEASRQFEAMLVRQILEASRKPVIQSKLAGDSTTGSIYRDMINNQLAESISKSGTLGLAKSFEQQLTPKNFTTPEPGNSTLKHSTQQP